MQKVSKIFRQPHIFDLTAKRNAAGRVFRRRRQSRHRNNGGFGAKGSNYFSAAAFFPRREPPTEPGARRGRFPHRCFRQADVCRENMRRLFAAQRARLANGGETENAPGSARTHPACFRNPRVFPGIRPPARSRRPYLAQNRHPPGGAARRRLSAGGCSGPEADWRINARIHPIGLGLVVGLGLEARRGNTITRDNPLPSPAASPVPRPRTRLRPRPIGDITGPGRTLRLSAYACQMILPPATRLLNRM